MTNLFIASPMEQFEIYPIQTLNLTLNNVILYMMIAALISITLAISHRGEIVATWWGIQSESLYSTILSMVENYIGRNYSVYFPLLYTVFHLILFCNQLGMVPYSTTPTVEIVMTLSLSFTQLVGTILLGAFTHKIYLFAAFQPSGVPIVLIPVMIVLETIATQTKILSLGLRQAINQTTGHIQVKTIIGFIYSAYLDGTSIFMQALPLFILSLFLALEILICYLQAYIFIFITCLTIKDFA